MTKSTIDVQASDLKVHGDPDAVDSFAACLCAVLEHFQQPASYAFVEALTGTCFAPCHNKGEDCVGWMVDGGSAARAGWMAGVFGLAMETIRLDPSAPKEREWFDHYQQTGIIPPAQQAYLHQVQSAYERGSVVVLGTWPAWSILSGWTDNLAKLPFTTTHGFENVVSQVFPPAMTRIALAFTPGGAQIKRAEAIREALRYGARVASGELSPRLEGYDSETEYGPAVYGMLAALAKEPHLCPGCQEHGCFQRTVKRIHNGQEAAVDFFKQEREWAPDGVHGLSLENLIEQYDHMALITRKYIPWPPLAAITLSPEFRDQLYHDFSALQIMQVQAAEHFQALVEDL